MQLIDYIRGKKHGKEANLLEREAMNDPFLQDAIDGFDTVQADHPKAIEELEKLLQQKVRTAKPIISYRIWATGIAATIVLMLGIGGLMYLDKKEPVSIAETKIKTVIRKKVIENGQSETVVQPSQKAIVYKTPKHPVEPVNEVQQLAEINDNVVVESTTSVSPVSTIQEKLLTTLPVKADQIAFKPIASGKMDSVRTLALNEALSGKMCGIVVDETNTPIPGATIRIRGANTFGSVTDLNGKFTIPKINKKSDKLVASYVGYISQEVPILTDSSIIRLKPNDLTLSEVVVVGYGAQSRTTVSGSISSNSAKNKKELYFGEKEFKMYFEHYRSKQICVGTEGKIHVSFDINVKGKPANVNVISSTCSDLTAELIRLLNDSPKWTMTRFKIELQIELK